MRLFRVIQCGQKESRRSVTVAPAHETSHCRQSISSEMLATDRTPHGEFLQMSLITRLPLARSLAAVGATSSLPATLVGLPAPAPPPAPGGRPFCRRRGVDHAAGTVPLPLHLGLSHGKNAYHVVLEASDSTTAALMGIN